VTDPGGAQYHDDPAMQRSLRRWQRWGAVIFLLLVLAFPMYLVTEATRRDSALASREVALTGAGRQVWAQSCAPCHGVTGEGVDAPALNSAEFLQTAGDEQIHSITAVGIPGTEMPAWWNEIGGPLTDEQIAAVVAFVRSWEDTAPSRPNWRTPLGPGGDHASD
jgi:mono/diheme cytochrome c family protein